MDVVIPEDLFDPAVWRALALPTSRMEACTRELEGVTDPKEAWESLAARGWIPEEAVDHPDRKFLWRLPDARPFARWNAVTRTVDYESEHKGMTEPRDLPFAIHLGSMWVGAMLAEDLAVEAHYRYKAWRAVGDGNSYPPRPRPAPGLTRSTHWQYAEPDHASAFVLRQFATALAERAPRAAGRAGRRVRQFLPDVPAAVRHHLTAAFLGHALLRDSAIGKEESKALGEMLHRPADEARWPDPFEPCLVAYAIGGFFIHVARANPLHIFATPDPLSVAGPAGSTEVLAISGRWNPTDWRIQGLPTDG